MHIENVFYPGDYSLILELTDKRIVGTSKNCSISICSIDYETKTWHHDVYKEHAHDQDIKSFCELPHSRLISGSNDYTIKVWATSKYELTLIQTLSQHTNIVHKVIVINDNVFASCSHDKTIKLWNNEAPYQEVSTLINESIVCHILHISKRNTLIASNYANSLVFWNVKQCKVVAVVKGVYSANPNHMIELPNDHIAVSSYAPTHPIVIVDVVKEIKEEGYITGHSSLCLVDDMSFVYVYDGRFVQIALKDYTVVYKSNAYEELNGFRGVLLVGNKKYLLIENKSNGVDVVTPVYL